MSRFSSLLLALGMTLAGVASAPAADLVAVRIDEFCVAGFDRWYVYNGRCRVLY